MADKCKELIEKVQTLAQPGNDQAAKDGFDKLFDEYVTASKAAHTDAFAHDHVISDVQQLQNQIRTARANSVGQEKRTFSHAEKRISTWLTSEKK